MKNKTLDEFTALTASKDPVPGGGGVSALAASLAASLSEMVTNLTIGKKRYQEYEAELQEIREETEALRLELLECIRKDAEAFKPLSEVYGEDRNAEGHEERMEECLRRAAASPFAILKLCTRIIEIDERLAIIGSKLSVSDAATGVMLGHGVLYGAAINVLVNTRLMKDRDYADKLDKETEELVREYSARALKTYDDIKKRLTDNG
ncbi:MAG: cyclodeaminase/cyclohydrolase family protein [Erysipelotrichaceae bacterium]|nr:cyclodeaminase/cyclohydrolase family protein [Erysipelotrichaceae bacterium]